MNYLVRVLTCKFGGLRGPADEQRLASNVLRNEHVCKIEMAVMGAGPDGADEHTRISSMG